MCTYYDGREEAGWGGGICLSSCVSSALRNPQCCIHILQGRFAGTLAPPSHQNGEMASSESELCSRRLGRRGSRCQMQNLVFLTVSQTASLSQSATLDLKSKEEKDAELDKRIEALRRKNEALIRRYQVP